MTGGPPRQIVVSTKPTIGSRILGTTQILVAGILEITVLLYFLLAGGDLFLQKFVKMLPTLRDKRKAVEFARAIEAAVSAYLSTALFVNLSEGVVVGLCLWALGMPSRPSLGSDDRRGRIRSLPWRADRRRRSCSGRTGDLRQRRPRAPIPGSFLAINLIQANLVTPMLLGHRLTLNPVAIFVGLTFFFWIWGVAGAFLAVPLLATLKIVCDHIGSLAALGEFLGERDHREPRVATQPKADAV